MNRSGRRVRSLRRFAYVGVVQDLEGEAEIIDLSLSGCRAICRSPPHGRFQDVRKLALNGPLAFMAIH